LSSASEFDAGAAFPVARVRPNFADEIAAPFTLKLLKEKRLANALWFAEMSTAVSGEEAL
jgi:hypothetical protein